MAHFRIESKGVSGASNTTITMDGKPFHCVTAVDLHLDANETTKIQLAFIPFDGVFFEGEAHSTFRQDCFDDLIRLGWTPPEPDTK